MKRREVVFAPEAVEDLARIHDWIASAAAPQTAASYLARLEDYCLRLDLASKRGTSRDDIRPGLRVVGFERRVLIAFVVEDKAVIVLRLYYGGQDWEGGAGG